MTGERLDFYPRMRMAGLSGGLMLALFSVLALLNLDSGLVRALAIFTIGAVIAAAFASPYLLRRNPTMSIDGAGITLLPTFSRDIARSRSSTLPLPSASLRQRLRPPLQARRVTGGALR